MTKHRRWIAVLLLSIFTMSTIGCATIKIGGHAQLAPSSEVGKKIAEKRYWYALYGVIPLSDNTTDNLIPPNVKRVRVETKWTAMDFILSIFTEILTIYCWTAEIYEVE